MRHTCYQCGDAIIGEDDDAGICVKCGGRNRSLKTAWMNVCEINDQNFHVIQKLQNEVLAAERLSKIYFQIAADAIGEDAVRRIRDYEIRSLKDNE